MGLNFIFYLRNQALKDVSNFIILMKLFLLGLLLLLVYSCGPLGSITDTPPDPEDLPDPVERGDIRFFIMSDLNSSYGSTDYQWQVDSTVVWLPRYAPDMVLSAGDLVAGQLRDLTDDEIAAMWDGFEEHIADSLRAYGIPYAPAMGNHDGSNAHEDFQRERDNAKEYFNRDEFDWGISFVDEANFPFWYSFEIGDIFFVVWDATSAQVPEECLQWAEEQLASERAQNAEMRMMMGHLSLYPVAVGRNRPGELLYDPDELLAMMEEYEVHTYISGHNHAYYPGRRGEVDLLHTGATGSGPRQVIGNPDEPRHTFTIVDIWPEEGRTIYTTVDARTAEIIEKSELPKYTEGINGYVMRRDLGMPSGFAGELFGNPVFAPATKTHGEFHGSYSDGTLEISGHVNNENSRDLSLQLGTGSLLNQDSILTEKTISGAASETVEFSFDHEIGRFTREQLKSGLLHISVFDKSDNRIRYKGQLLEQANSAPYEPEEVQAEWDDQHLEVSWQAQKDPDSDPVHYIIQVAEESGFEELAYTFHAGAGTDALTLQGFNQFRGSRSGYVRIVATDGMYRIASDPISVP